MNFQVKTWSCLALIFFYGHVAFPQSKEKHYDNEFIWGINKNTAGGLIGGFIFKKSIRKSARVLVTYGLEIMNVKHPQESRLRAQTGSFFIYGKSNYLYALRPQYGRDFILFKKLDWSSVEIKGVVAVGPSIGIVTPYHIQWQSSFREAKNEQYDPSNPSHSYSKIIGPGFFLDGLSKSKIQLGGNFKVGLNFDMGAIRFEIGFLLDAYFNKIIMVPTAENYALFPSLYFTLCYGRRQ